MTKYEKDMLKFEEYGAARNDEGKYLVYAFYEGEAGGLAYFLDGEYRRRRIFTKTFYRLLEEGKAVRIEPDEAKTLIKEKRS
ncbi:MAG: hypothetical protein IKO74_00250 [Selenomonadaceae bacterium]|nr:hypothetical protein [Selenomonadaceae bacterium]